MRSLAGMVSVRPVSGALMDYPYVFVDKALGITVGIFYWEVAGHRIHLLPLTGGTGWQIV